MKNTANPTGAHGSFLSYVLGFALSVMLTLGAFWIAPTLGPAASFAVVLAALIQLIVQLVFFLHLGRGPERELNLVIFGFTSIIVFILVGGTLWIMSNLAHLHMQPLTPTDIYQGGVVAPQNELH